jgi:hypothetical protein
MHLSSAIKATERKSTEMKIDDTYMNIASNVPNSIAYCECHGADASCLKCDGTGRIFLPFICLFENCDEGFQSLLDLNEHMMKEHGAFSITFQ